MSQVDEQGVGGIVSFLADSFWYGISALFFGIVGFFVRKVLHNEKKWQEAEKQTVSVVASMKALQDTMITLEKRLERSEETSNDGIQELKRDVKQINQNILDLARK